jgi:hypothetical protein
MTGDYIDGLRKGFNADPVPIGYKEKEEIRLK